MPGVKYLARDWVFAIDTGTSGTPALVPIGGLTTWSPSNTKTDVDDTTFESDGHEEHKVAARGGGLTLEGFWIVDPDTGDMDPGQEALIALSEAIGYDSTKPVTATSPAGTTRGSYSVNVNYGGGGINANGAFSATLTRSGAPTFTPAT